MDQINTIFMSTICGTVCLLILGLGDFELIFVGEFIFILSFDTTLVIRDVDG